MAAGTDMTTLGIKFAYGIESTAGTKPTKFTQLPRCRKVAGISLSQEKIDLSCLEDYTAKYGSGRQDTGGDWSATFLTGAISDVKAMMAASAAAATGLRTWFEVYVPGLTDAFFIVANPGSTIPLPDISDNSALEFDVSLTIEEYIGMEAAVEPTAAA